MLRSLISFQKKPLCTDSRSSRRAILNAGRRRTRREFYGDLAVSTDLERLQTILCWNPNHGKDFPDEAVFTDSIWTRTSPTHPGLTEILPSGKIFRSDAGAALQNRRLY